MCAGPWLQNSVGSDNHHFFYIFLVSHLLLQLVFLRFMAIHYYYYDFSSVFSFVAEFYRLHPYVATVCGWHVLNGFWLFLLAVQHTVMLVRNQTTTIFWSPTKYPHMKVGNTCPLCYCACVRKDCDCTVYVCVYMYLTSVHCIFVVCVCVLCLVYALRMPSIFVCEYEVSVMGVCPKRMCMCFSPPPPSPLHLSFAMLTYAHILFSLKQDPRTRKYNNPFSAGLFANLKEFFWDSSPVKQQRWERQLGARLAQLEDVKKQERLLQVAIPDKKQSQ
jgi:DHHC palmitoyltransferase